MPKPLPLNPDDCRDLVSRSAEAVLMSVGIDPKDVLSALDGER